MYVADGQVLNAPVKVFVSFANIDRNMMPRLRLAPFHAQSRTDINLQEWEPFVVAANQTWTEKVADQNVERSGTLLMFDLNKFPTDWWKSATRVTPVLTWTEPGNPKPMLVGQSLYLGRRGIAGLWTGLTLAILIVLFWWMAKEAILDIEDPKIRKAMKGAGVLYFLSGPDNYMSLWRTQLAAWTIAVGGMVLMFGIIQFDVPRIPETLVALMGLSVATGGLSALATKKSPSGEGNGTSPTPTVPPPSDATVSVNPSPVVAPNPPSGLHKKAEARSRGIADRPRWWHLISSYSEDAPSKKALSVSKAQMVFWTGIILVLFVVKSILRGELWEVPWELVTLTGVSQAGYVSDKAVERARENQAAEQRAQKS